MRVHFRTTRSALVGGVVALALTLTGCSGSSGGSTTPQDVTQDAIDEALSTPTTLTFWTWNDVQSSIDAFEEKYPAITVDMVNVGSGSDFYTKLRSAIKAGNGAPDVAQVEYQHIPSFVLGGDLADLSPYLDDSTADSFESFAWNQVVVNDGVYGIPQDTGPVGLLYREDIFTAAGIAEAPATWDDFATAAEAIHAADPDHYIANISPSNGSATLGLFWQAGAVPFGYDGDQTVTVDLTSPAMVQVAEYWQDLIDRGLVSVDPDFTDQWYQGLASGRYASWASAAWGPLFLQGTAEDTTGLWRASELPQWDASAPASGSIGGSADAVLASSENQIAAAKFVEFLNSDADSNLTKSLDQSLFPALTATLADPAFTDAPVEFFGGQQVNQVFAEISPTVSTDFTWLPFMDPVFESYNTTFGKALTDGTSLVDGLQAWQDAIVDYAESQGFTVQQ
jgi:multiple sugar transport system substrate-binding protein